MGHGTDSRPSPFVRFTMAAAALAIVGALGRTCVAAEPTAAKGPSPLTQPGCDICIIGTPTVRWSGSSGSFHVDRVENLSNPWQADIGLFVALTSQYPDLGVPTEIGPGADIFELYRSDTLWLAPLAVGGSHANIDSGTIRFDGSRVPAGEYWMAVVLFDCPYPCLYHDYVVMNDKVSCDGSSCRVEGTSPPEASSLTRLLPIVLDVASGSIHYTTGMAVTNNTSSRLSISMLYTASLGSGEGSGGVTDSLAPGEQKQIDDVLAYLRERGLAIPSLAEHPSQGGTLLVTFQGNDAIDPKLVSVVARTVALTSSPHPVGRAGLA